MRAAIILVAAVAVSGCANTSERAFYAQGFVAKRLGQSSFESCSSENAGVRVGHEWRVMSNVKVAVEAEHVSHLMCGRPFGDKFEHDSYLDHAGITITVGGLK